MHRCEVEICERVGGEVEGGKGGRVERGVVVGVEGRTAGWVRETRRGGGGGAVRSDGGKEGVEGLRERARTVPCRSGSGERIRAIEPRKGSDEGGSGRRRGVARDSVGAGNGLGRVVVRVVFGGTHELEETGADLDGVSVEDAAGDSEVEDGETGEVLVPALGDGVCEERRVC